jgi:transcription elongation GreA/GreB family factor
MSRAFTKEIDDAPLAPMPDRRISDAPNLVTPDGASMIEAKLKAARAALGKATDPTRQAELRREERYWLARQATKQVVPRAEAPTAVGFGVTVQLRRNGKVSQLRIVGEDEADPAHGGLAWTSPLALALEGAMAGETVEVQVGSRTDLVQVLAVGV